MYGNRGQPPPPRIQCWENNEQSADGINRLLFRLTVALRCSLGPNIESGGGGAKGVKCLILTGFYFSITGVRLRFKIRKTKINVYPGLHIFSWLKTDAPLSLSVVFELYSLLGWLLGSHAALVANAFLNFHP